MPDIDSLPPSADPWTRLGQLGLSEASVQVLRELGFATLTPIQAQGLPILLTGRDLVGQSATGSGKTLAFALPILQGLQLDRRHVQALVLCPTRELATQVAASIRTFGRRLAGLRVLLVCGGVPSGPQRKALQDGVHVVVGTPGRTLDLLGRGLDLSAVRTVVLDEADRMLDMGFAPAVEQVLRGVPTERQTVFFSATFPTGVAAMSRAWQRNPAHLQIVDDQTDKPAIRQIVHLVAPTDRQAALGAVLAAHNPKSALVFCNFKETARSVAALLAKTGLPADALHGDLDQRDRDRVMAKFRNGTVKILVATDVAARGLDIAGLQAVIQFELPNSAETYVHRIGRTGRAGAPGLAIALAGPGDLDRLRGCEEAAGSPAERLPVPTLKAHRTAAPHSGDDMATLFVGGGRKDKLRAGDILGALSGDAGLKATDIGRIEIADRYTYVALPPPVLAGLLAKLPGLRIKGKSFRIERVQ